MVTILHLDNNYNLYEKITAEEADIQNNLWILKNVNIFNMNQGVFQKETISTFSLESNYNYEKINNLFKNFDTTSFIDLIFNYNNLIESGYSKVFLDQALHTLLSIPFFLLVMTGLASILTLNTLKKVTILNL